MVYTIHLSGKVVCLIWTYSIGTSVRSNLTRLHCVHLISVIQFWNRPLTVQLEVEASVCFCLFWKNTFTGTWQIMITKNVFFLVLSKFIEMLYNRTSIKIRSLYSNWCWLLFLFLSQLKINSVHEYFSWWLFLLLSLSGRDVFIPKNVNGFWFSLFGPFFSSFFLVPVFIEDWFVSN